MSFQKLKYIVSATLIAMLLHTVEEYTTKLWNFDPFIIVFSRHFEINPVVVYLLIQALALLVIIGVLMLVLYKKFNRVLGIVLGLIFLLELLHPYNSIRVWGYYPGLYSGMALVAIGYFYLKELKVLILAK